MLLFLSLRQITGDTGRISINRQQGRRWVCLTHSNTEGDVTGMKNRNRLLTVLLSTLLVFSLTPAMAFADQEDPGDPGGTPDPGVAAVCEIDGGALYASLEDAFDVVQSGDTIRLLCDITLSGDLQISNSTDFAFDTGGYTLDFADNMLNIEQCAAVDFVGCSSFSNLGGVYVYDSMASFDSDLTLTNGSLAVAGGYLGGSSEVTVNGDLISQNSSGVIAAGLDDGFIANVLICGDVYAHETGVQAQGNAIDGNASVTVEGDVIAGRGGVVARNGAMIEIGGNVIVTGETALFDEDCVAIECSGGDDASSAIQTVVVVSGNVTFTGSFATSENFAINALNSGQVMIGGYFTSANNLTVVIICGVPTDGVSSSVYPGFDQYISDDDLTIVIIKTVPLSSDCEITGFSIGDIDATIDGAASTITITLPYGTSLVGITPDIDYIGASIDPEGPQDFSSPVAYTVTAEDGSTRGYLATVNVAAPPLVCEIVGNYGYTSLEAALNAVQNGQTIMMLLDVTLDADLQISNGKKFAFDTDGKTLDFANNYLNIDSSSNIDFTGCDDFCNLGGVSITDSIVSFDSGLTLTIGSLEVIGGSDVTVNGDLISQNSSGVVVTVFDDYWSNCIAINGDILAFDTGILAEGLVEGNITMAVSGNVVAGSRGVVSRNGANIQVNGSVTITGEADPSEADYVAIDCNGGYNDNPITPTYIVVNGNVTFSGDPQSSENFAINASNNGKAIVGGFFTSANEQTVININGMQTDKADSSQIADFDQYSVGTPDDLTAVWILSSSNEIVSFFIDGAMGLILGNSISVVLAGGTDVTSLTPAIIHTGKFILPSSTAAQDFSSPVTYTVTAANGTIREYTVTVAVAPAIGIDPTDVTIFVGADASFTVDNVTGIPSTFTFQWQVSTDDSDSWVDLTDGGAYTGTDSDALSVIAALAELNGNLYRCVVSNGVGSGIVSDSARLMVNVPLSSDMEIVSFKINDVEADIDDTGNTISITLPYGTPLDGITPVIEFIGASIWPDTPQNFSSPVIYTVEAEDGSTRDYTVIVTLAPGQAPAIGVEPADTTVVAGTDATFSVGDVTGTPLLFDYQWYASTDNGTSWFGITDGTVYSGTDTATLSINTAPTGFNGYLYRCTVSNGIVPAATSGSARLTVTNPPSSSKDITYLSINGAMGLISGTSITVTLPYGAAVTSLTPAITHTGVTISPTGARNFSTPVTYTVTAEDGSTKAYTVTVTVAPAPAPVLTEGVYTISPKCAPGLVLDVANGSTSDGANVQIWAYNDTPSQTFRVVSAGNGYYRIINVETGKALDVAGAGKTSGTNVWMYGQNSTDAQLWKAVVTGDSDGAVYLVSACNNLYLDILGAANTSGANVQVFTGNQTNAQKFFFRSVTQTLANGEYVIVSRLSSSSNEMVADVSNASTAAGANIQLYRSNGTGAQRFRITYNAQTGYYTITNINSGMLLDVANASSVSGANVWQYGSNNTRAQWWRIVANGDGSYRIISATSGCVLDVSNAGTANGTNIQVFTPNGTNAQKWTFKKQ